MNNKVKQIDVKNPTYYFLMMCQYKKSRSNKVKVDEKSYINVFIYYIGYLIVKNLG